MTFTAQKGMIANCFCPATNGRDWHDKLIGVGAVEAMTAQRFSQCHANCSFLPPYRHLVSADYDCAPGRALLKTEGLKPSLIQKIQTSIYR